MFKKTFVEAYLAGEASIGDIDNWVDYWHTHETGHALHEFLGMTHDEYEQWLKSGENAVLQSILEARK